MHFGRKPAETLMSLVVCWCVQAPRLSKGSSDDTAQGQQRSSGKITLGAGKLISQVCS